MPYATKKPYSRTYAKKKGYYKGPSSKVTKRDVAKIARSVVNKSKTVKEKRFHSFKALTTDTVANAFERLDITNIESGTASDERDGRDIVYLGCRYKLSFDNARVQERYIRVMVLQAKNVNDPPDLTGYNDLYQDANRVDRAADNLVGDITFPLNTDVFHIHMDKLIKLSSAGNDVSSKTIQGYLKFNKRLQYDNEGASSNVPVNGGQIWFVVHACENYSPTGVTTTVTNYDGFFRCFFTDS